ncbi:MAG: hypothetical protein PVJ49_04750 [Acidobacteriota bacterium]|jgi:hypothetical protein
MVPLTSLWMPIVLAAVIVFVASSLIHMVLKYHQSDYGKIAGEDAVMATMRESGVTPGDYVVPHGDGPSAMKDPAFIEKWTKGPAAVITVLPAGPPAMGKQLVMWFVYCLLVGLFAGYISGRALGPGADYLAVFRFAGAIAFIGYSLALLQNSIWFSKSWGATLKSVFDGLIYGLLTAGCFGWLWPR